MSGQDAFFDKPAYWGGDDRVEPVAVPRLIGAPLRAWPTAANHIGGVLRQVVTGDLVGTELPPGTPLYPYDRDRARSSRGGAYPGAVLLLTTEYMRPATPEERRDLPTEWTPSIFPADPPDDSPRDLLARNTLRGTYKGEPGMHQRPANRSLIGSEGRFRYTRRVNLVCMTPIQRGRALPIQLKRAFIPDDQTKPPSTTVMPMGPEWAPGAIGDSQTTYHKGTFQQVFRIISAEVVQYGEPK
jgi:hypothetical protein